MGADEASDNSAVIEHEEGWKALDTQMGRDVLVLVGVQFGKAQFSLIFFAQLLIDGSDIVAVGAPLGPEIDDNGEIGFEDLLLEILISYVKQIILFKHLFVQCFAHFHML